MAPQRILLVDDQADVRQAISMLLNCAGHIVETAVNGEDGLAKFVAGQFDLVITDLKMPVMGGDALALAIKARAPQQPIIMITAHEADAPPSVDAFLNKPFSYDALNEAIMAVLPAKPA